jgi:hypothetical protein
MAVIKMRVFQKYCQSLLEMIQECVLFVRFELLVKATIRDEFVEGLVRILVDAF